jgi:steroid 5-alpha reductase family enzyme
MTFGTSASNLQHLAIRVLSQTCSSSGWNWRIFEHIHSKKRNRLEHQRLNDLVYVHSNLRLKQKYFLFSNSLNIILSYLVALLILILCLSSLWIYRNYWKGWNYGSINFETICNIENWVVEDDPSILTIKEVKSFHQPLSTMTI